MRNFSKVLQINIYSLLFLIQKSVNLFTFRIRVLSVSLVILPFSSLTTEAAKIVKTVYPTVDIVVVDYDVTDYGADLTGITDATAAIQNAINACYNSGGGTVWMPAGTYKVNGTDL